MAVAAPAVAQVEDVPAVPDLIEDAAPAGPPAIAALATVPSRAVVDEVLAAPVSPTDGQAVSAVGQIRQAVQVRDWGLLVGAAALLLLWVVTRFVVPAAHGGIGWKIAAYAATLAGYCATNIASGMEVADIAWTVGLGALLAAVAVFAPPAKPVDPGARVEVRVRPPSPAGCVRPGMLAFLAIVAALVLLGAAACQRLPDQVRSDSVAIADLYRGYVQADPLMTPSEKADRQVLIDKQAYIGTSGYASPAFKDVASTVTCAVEWYVAHDPARLPAFVEGVVKTTRAIREALKLPLTCPEGGAR